MILILWIASIVFLAAVYPGVPLYFLALSLLSRLKKTNNRSDSSSPAVWPKLSFIIPVFNESAVIERKLRNTLELKYPRVFEVVAVDDGSTDSTVEIIKSVKSRGNQLQCIENQRLGKAHALRTGIEAAKGELIAVSDADTFLSKTALVEAAAVLVNYPEVGCVSGVIVNEEKGTGLFHRIGESIRVMESAIWTASHPSGVFACFKRELVDDLTESSSTDVDIGLRIIQKGYRIRVLDTIRCEHRSPETLSKDFISFVVRPFVGRIHALRKFHSFIFRKRLNLFETFILFRYMVLFLFEPFAFFTFSLTSIWLLFYAVFEGVIPVWILLFAVVGFLVIDFSSKNVVSMAIARRAIFYVAEIVGLLRYAVKGQYTKWRMSQRG